MHRCFLRRVRIGLVVAGLAAGASCSRSTAEAHALLDEYGAMFAAVASSGSVDRTGLLERLEELGKHAHALRAADRIDQRFAARYERLLTVARLLITRSQTWEGVAMDPAITAFVREVTGRPLPPNARGFAVVAPAIVEEMLSLRMLLDRTSDREAARARYLPK